MDDLNKLLKKNNQESPQSLDEEDENNIPVQQWIDWYLSIAGNEFLVPVTMGFLFDNFSMFEFLGDEPNSAENNNAPQNRQHVHQIHSYSEEAYKMIKGIGPRSYSQLNDPEFQKTY